MVPNAPIERTYRYTRSGRKVRGPHYCANTQSLAVEDSGCPELDT